MQGQHMTGCPGLVQFGKETTRSHSPAELTVHTAEHLEEAGPRRLVWPGGLLPPGSSAKQAGSQQHSTQQLHPALQGPRDREGQSHGQSWDPVLAPQHLLAATASPPPWSGSAPPGTSSRQSTPILTHLFFPTSTSLIQIMPEGNHVSCCCPVPGNTKEARSKTPRLRGPISAHLQGRQITSLLHSTRDVHV